MKPIIIAALAIAAAAPASAAITWTDWTSASAAGASGTIGSKTVTAVVNAGSIHNWQVSGGTDYWHSSGTTPWAAYDGVSNTPTNNDFIAPDTGSYTFNFSSAVTDPYLAIISLGQTSVPTQWTFDQPFSLVDVGQGFWGSGGFTIAGSSITAGEGHGIIRFSGTFTSLTLRSSTGEFWSGMTFGESAVPEPATWAMLIAGFGMVGAAARRRRPVLARASA